MSFADLSVKLRADISDFAQKMREARKEANNFSSTFGSSTTSKGNNMLMQASGLRNSYREATKELKSHNLGLKDTSRIIQGIMVSQAFYSIAGSIRDAATSLWDFNVALDYAKVTYSALFGDANLANNFMTALQQHSIETIFDYQSLTDASKKLLAYGIEYENLMFIMEGLTNLGAMSGDSAALDRISLALGQIYTKGKLSAEEMRQLANAYIPITDILQDKFGLTGDDLKRVGDLNLPAADVINAIVDYANENFGNVGDAAMMTITGLQSKIVDTLKVVGSEMLQPITTAYKSFLVYISDGLEAVRNAYATGGAGGVFEYLVPDENKQQLIRQFLANVKNLFRSLREVGSVLIQVFGQFASVFMYIFNMLAPIIAGITNILAGLAKALLDNSTVAKVLRVALVGVAAGFILVKATALKALVVTALTKAFTNLAKALILIGGLISKNPFIAVLVGIAAAVAGVAVATDKAEGSLMGMFDTLSGDVGGTSSDDILQKTNKELEDAANAADEFNNRLKDSTDAADDLTDAIGGAGKEAKKTAGLLSFDEVFRLNDQKDSGAGVGSGLLGSLGDLTDAFSGLGDLFVPEVPDFSEFTTKFVDDLYGDLFAKLKKIAGGGAFGAIVGALTGFTIGGLVTKSMKGALYGAKLGAKIGGIAGAGFAAFWEEAYNKVEGALLNITAGAAAGGLMGAVAGFIIGAFATRNLQGAIVGSQIGTAVGAFIGGTIGIIFDDVAKVMSERISQIAHGGATGALLSAVAGFFIGAFSVKTLHGALTAAKIGAGIGTVIGGTIGGIFGDSQATLSSIIKGLVSGSAIGATIGGLAGMIIGAFATKTLDGALTAAKMGATIGTLIGGTLGVIFTDASGELRKTISGLIAGSYWGAIAGAITGLIVGAFATKTLHGALTAAKIGATIGALIGGTLGGIFADAEGQIKTVIEGLTSGNAWGALLGGFAGFALGAFITKNISGALTGAALGTTVGSMIGGYLTTIFGDAKDGVTTTLGSLWDGIEEAAMSTIVAGLAGMLIGALVGTFAGGIGALPGAIAGAKLGVIGASLGELVYNALRGSGMLGGVKRFFNWLGSEIKDAWNGVWSFFTEEKIDGGIWGVITSTKVPYGPNKPQAAHATGGIFNREHIARFAEGNKAEAIIPLENNTAMQPFVDAVSNGLLSTLAPLVVQGNSGSTNNNLPPLYVGTLIADDRGLKELYKKFEVIQLQENDRRGLHATV